MSPLYNWARRIAQQHEENKARMKSYKDTRARSGRQVRKIKLTAEEKAKLQEKIDEEWTRSIHPPKKEAGNLRMKTVKIVLPIVLVGLLFTLLEYAIGLVIPLPIKMGIILLLLIVHFIQRIWREPHHGDRDK